MDKKLCQSCGMPLTEESHFGTEVSGEFSKDYCKYCYNNGEFNKPDETMDEMIKTCIPFMVKEGIPEIKAKEQLELILPNLNRWRII